MEDWTKIYAPTTPMPSGGSWLEAFTKSTVGAMGEFVGIEKSLEQQKWDAQHPWSSLGADLVGYAVPFGVWNKATKEIKGFEKVISSIGNMEKSPIVTKGMQEIARIAPLEAGRIAAAATIGDRPIGDTLANVALDFGTVGVFAGVGQGLQEYGKKRLKLSDIVPGASSELPPQLQMRAANEYLAANKDLAQETVDTIKNRMSEFEKIVRLEEVAPGFKYVGDVEQTSGKDINRLFDVRKESPSIDRKLFMSGPRGFTAEYAEGAMTKSAQQKMDETWAKANMGVFRDQLPYMQFPRFINAKKGSSAGFVQGAIQRDMQNIGDNLWITRERNNGLFVLAKKIEGTEKAAAKDQWILFKTDNPGRFAPVQEGWAQNIVDKAKWMAEPEKIFKPTGSKIYDYAEEMSRKFPMMGYIGSVESRTKLAKRAEQIADKMGLDKVSGAKQAFGEFFNRYFVPNAFQFTKSPKANWINGMSRAIYDEADKISHTMMFGEHFLKDKNLMKAALKGTETQGGVSVSSLLKKLDDKDLADVWKAWNSQMSPSQVNDAFAAGRFSERSKEFLTHMSKLDDDMIAQIQTTQAAYGQDLFKPMKNHYMISRTWNGAYRVPIQNDAGQLIYMAAGKTPRQAEDLANKIIREAGASWTAKPPILADASIESPVQLAGYFNDMAMNRPEYFEAAKAAEKVFETYKPRFMKGRKNVGGFAAETAPWDKNELEEIIMRHIQQQNKYIARLVVNEKFGVDRARLLAEDPAMFNVLEDRLKDLEGKKGPVSEVVNKVTDKILAPVLGPNSASKIASVTNSSFMHFQMGALTLTQPIQTLLGFTNTVLPEIAFVLGAVPERRAPYYGVWPIAGSDGKITNYVHVLEPLRIFKNSFGEMRNPSKELFSHFERAASEGVISPRMVEDYIGEGAVKIKDLRRAIEGPGNFVSWLGEVSGSLISATEKLSRGNAFTIGHMIGRDFLGYTDEGLYQFAKRFTQRTMYGYATADRSRIFTTPVGSMLGLFKNWMMHYMATMMQYTGEGLTQGNWAPLMWQTAGVTAVGGIAASGPLYFMADKFSEMASDKSLMQNIYEMTGGPNVVSDGLFFGLPSLLGVSLTGSVNSPGSNPTRDITQLFSFVHLDRMNAAGRALGTAIDQYEATGRNPMDNELVRLQMARAFLPKTIYRVLGAWNDKGIRSLSTGNITVDQLSPSDRLMYMTGLNPTRVDREMRVGDELYQDQQKMKEAVRAAGLAFYEAQKNGDKYMMHQVMMRSIAQGMDFSRVLRSVNARANKESGDQIERKFDPRAIWEKRMMLK